ncbi:ABC transporter permease [Demequina sp. NBRC 110056]|uniref:ABC transporter permease n=1 Tax=Demequina sp. NBRC 110056 TaxID=1570345 RepID=UPI0009FFCB84|nr:ABC transporter permease [Demequina sp. NBRC 110056]
MGRFITRRVISGISLLFVISSAAYLLLYISSGDVARNLLGPTATDEQVAAKAAELGLDQPLLTRYWDWLTGALTGDFGTSWASRAPVTEVLGGRVSVTLTLVIAAVIVSALGAIVLGTLAASRGGWSDRTIQVVSLIGAAVPGFLIAMLLVLFVAIDLGWFAATGYVRPTESFSGWIQTAVLPITALAVAGVAAVTQQVRGSMLDEQRKDYVRTLECRGLSRRSIVFRHVLRNAATPALNVLALMFIALLGGAVVVEQVFAIPGLGKLTVSSTLTGDVPVIMGIVVVTVMLVVAVNLLIDLIQAWLNPKVRLS